MQEIGIWICRVTAFGNFAEARRRYAHAPFRVLGACCTGIDHIVYLDMAGGTMRSSGRGSMRACGGGRQ